jgi:hypothetical protein
MRVQSLALLALLGACRTQRSVVAPTEVSAVALDAAADDVAAVSVDEPDSGEPAPMRTGPPRARAADLSRWYRQLPARRDPAAMSAATEAWRWFFVGPSQSAPPMPVEFIGADGTRGLQVTLEPLPGELTLMHATDPESDCMSHRAVLLTPDGDVALGTELFGREYANGGLECSPRRPRLVGDPAVGPAVVRDGDEALLLVRTAPQWTFARPVGGQCAPREAPSPCGQGIYCESNGPLLGVVPPLDARARRCVAGAFEVERAFDAAIEAADTRAARSLGALLDTESDGMIEPPPPSASCATRDPAQLARVVELTRARFIEWAIAYGDGPRPRSGEVSLRRRAAAAHPPTIHAHCPSSAGALVLTAKFDGQRDGPGSEVFVTDTTVWRFDGSALSMLDALDSRSLYGAALVDVDSDGTEDLVLSLHTWESAARRIRAYSSALPRFVTLWADEAPEGRSRDERVLLVRDDDRALLFVDWVAHRWTGTRLTPTPVRSALLRTVLSRRSAVHDARATARDALARSALDARALDDALTVGGVSAQRAQSLLRMFAR